jgi:hypothetical protein
MAVAKKRKRGGAGGAAGAGGAGAGAAAAGAAGKGGGGGGSLPPFIDTDLKLLFANLTSPESPVQYGAPSRSTPGTIQTTINPPQATWTWPNQAARNAEVVGDLDVGKYGFQTDVNTLYRLASASPNTVWQPVQDFTNATWTWPNASARMNQPVLPGDVDKVGYQSDIDTYYLLTAAAPPVWQPVPKQPIELSTGAADADSYHDFYRLRIAFEDVWAELLDTGIQQTGQQLYAMWDALMETLPPPVGYDDSGAADRGKRWPGLPVDQNGNPLDIAGADELQNFLNNLSILLGDQGVSLQGAVQGSLTALQNAVLQTLLGCNMLMDQMNRLGQDNNPPFFNTGQFPNAPDGTTCWLNDTANNAANDGDSYPQDLAPFGKDVARKNVFNNIANALNSAGGGGQPPAVTFPEIGQMLSELSDRLKERYRFDVFAPSSINYGVLLNYRQHWQPQSYQVGDLVATIPLAPQETRKYTTKTVIKKTRSVKEIQESLRSGKDESSQTSRADAEIVDRAKNDTNFKYNASGSYGGDALPFKVEGGVQGGNDAATESSQTKREFHEAVLKSAQEYRNERKTEVSTEETREDETTSYREIRNPNDELTVTYLFYELQRRYLVDENLYRATPVILVANDVPAPHEVDQAWILRYDWIIKRAILDDSFLPALDYLSTNYTGEEVTLLTLEMEVQHQRDVVDKLSQQVQVADIAVNAAALGVRDAQQQQINDLQAQEAASFFRSFVDPLNISQTGKVDDGNSDRARIDMAKDVLQRAQDKSTDVKSQLRTELTALQVAIDKYTGAATKHYGMLADIDRLRLHVKDNIIHYMQAIWTYEPPDQRYFRLYNLDVPVFTQSGPINVVNAAGIGAINPSRPALKMVMPPPEVSPNTMKLHQVAEVETLLGFKGNYMIFPVANFDNYMVWYLMQDYIHFDALAGVIAADPEPTAGMTLQQLQAAMAAIFAQDPASFTANEAAFEQTMMKLLSDASQKMVILPSKQLYIEALPGSHPLLEDFKLIHRALDVKKAQAEVRKAEIENLRLAARLENVELGDPDIDKVVVVGSGQNVTVDAGQ